MKQNYSLWIGLVVLVVVVAAVIFWRTPGTTVAPGTETATTTDDGSGTTAGTQPSTGSTGKPIGVTVGFASVTSTAALVKGTVDPRKAVTTYWFEYGTSMSYGSSTARATIQPSSANVPVSAALVGLKPSTTYYFRVADNNAYGTSYGSVYSFITAAK